MKRPDEPPRPPRGGESARGAWLLASASLAATARCVGSLDGRRDDSYGISLTQNVFHGFACPARGSLLDFVARKAGSRRGKGDGLRVEAPPDRRSWAILAQDFGEAQQIFPRNEKRRPKEERTRGMKAPIASRRSENGGHPSAVEMTPRGKRGKLKKRVSHSFHRAWKIRQKISRISHISTAPAAVLYP